MSTSALIKVCAKCRSEDSLEHLRNKYWETNVDTTISASELLTALEELEEEALSSPSSSFNLPMENLRELVISKLFKCECGSNDFELLEWRRI